ncbi:MAG: hypothetical protein ACYC27_14640 [Armatimonadota bacterium]
MKHGQSNFGGGETIIDRVTTEDPSRLERCNGWDPTQRRLKPEPVVGNITSGAALTGTLAQQSPAVFIVDGVTRIIARDKDELMREFLAGSWSAAGGLCPILPESRPIRVGRQIIFCTDGPHAKMMAYEPESPTTKLRPNSMKSPADYHLGEKPRVTQSTAAADYLFDNDDANVWAIADGAYGSVVNAADKTVITLGSGAVADQLVAKKSMAAQTRDLTGKHFLVIDMMITESPQPTYALLGLFANNAALLPSGYSIGLYTDAACTTLAASYRIPRFYTQGKVNRVVLSLGDPVATIQGVGIITDSFFTPPAGTATYNIALYSESYNAGWSHKGNFLMPAASRWPLSPWAEKLKALTSVTGGAITLPPSSNLVTNGGFEDGETGWTIGGGGTRKGDLARTGGFCVELDWDNEYLQQTGISVSAGIEYELEMWIYSPSSAAREWHIELTYKSGLGVTVGTGRFPTTGTILLTNDGYERQAFRMLPPAGTATVTMKIIKDTGGDGNWRVDDISLVKLNKGTAGTACILQEFTEDGADLAALTPRVEYCYCYAARSLLGTDDFVYMISNPSDASKEDPLTVADPWRTNTIAIALSSGPVGAVVLNAAGTGYTAGDILTVVGNADGGTGAKIRVLTIGALGAVASIELVLEGEGYPTAAGFTTTGGTGTGCTVDITHLDAIDEYGSYLTHGAVYRRIYDGDAQYWSPWKFIKSLPIGTAITWEDICNDQEPMIGGYEVPYELELSNDYASSARNIDYADGRIYASCLDWDNETGRWLRPLMIEVSSFDKPWAFPTSTDSDSPITDGSELGNFSVTGSEILGMISRNDEKYVHLDTEFFQARGDNPQEGWQFVRIDAIGSKGALTEVDCRNAIIWHGPDHFYAYSGGVAQPISRYSIDSTKIDWTKPYGAVYFKNRYIMHCTYDSVPALLQYELQSGAWRIRRAAGSLDLVGICTDGDILYGLTPGGRVIDLFGSTGADYGAASTVREVWTRFQQIASYGEDIQIKSGIIEAITAEAAGVDLVCVFEAEGALCDSQTHTIKVLPGRTRYVRNLNLQGNAVRIKVTYTGITPPDILFIGTETDEVEV